MSTVSEVSKQDWAMWRAFTSMGRQLNLALDRQLQHDAGISSPDYNILLALYEAPKRRLRTGELAELLAWEKSRVSHQVSRMESRGLLERSECDTDGRGTWIGLTTDGVRATLGAMSDHAAQIRELFFDKLSADERQVLNEVSMRILGNLDPTACDEAVAADEAACAAAESELGSEAR